MNDIDIYQLNLGPFRSLKFLIENPLKNVFSILLEQYIHNKFLFLKITPLPLEKGENFISEQCFFFIFLWFGNVS
jgi:hypothetical protein